MSNSLVTINLVILNGGKYIRHCLDAILAQTYPHELIELNILDNGSSDKTKEIIKSTRSDLDPFDMAQDKTRADLKGKFTKFNLVELTKNIGVWPAQEELLKYSNGKYVLGLCVDVIIDKDFIKKAVEIMEKDSKIGALQAKIYKYELSEVQPRGFLEVEPQRKILDTCGFRIEKSRRVTNIGHGLSFAEASASKELNCNEQQEIFGVEGACPVFRREALEDCRLFINSTKYAMAQSVENSDSSTAGEIFDHDYFWYGDDLDLAWRMNLFGWKQVFAPSVIAWHDRQTTKSLKKNWLDYIFRVPVRQQIPIKKRRLDWRNNRWTIIKNDYTINILRDLPYILWRELMVFGYTFLFEPRVFAELPNFIKFIPKMLRKRKEIMKRAVVKPEEMRRWFI